MAARKKGVDSSGGADATLFQGEPEFVLFENGSGDFQYVRADNIKDVMLPLIEDCPGYSGLSKKEKKNVLNFKNMIDLTQMLNDCHSG
jgi:hypothetical protein